METEDGNCPRVTPELSCKTTVLALEIDDVEVLPFLASSKFNSAVWMAFGAAVKNVEKEFGERSNKPTENPWSGRGLILERPC